MLGFQLSEAMCAKGYRKPEFNLKGGIYISPLFRPTLSGGEGGSLGFFGVLWGSLRIDRNARRATKKRRGRGESGGKFKEPSVFPSESGTSGIDGNARRATKKRRGRVRSPKLDKASRGTLRIDENARRATKECERRWASRAITLNRRRSYGQEGYQRSGSVNG